MLDLVGIVIDSTRGVVVRGDAGLPVNKEAEDSRKRTLLLCVKRLVASAAFLLQAEML